MTEQEKKRKFHRPMRLGLVAAAVAAMLVVTVSAANSEAVQELVYQITYSVRVGGYRHDLTTKDGDKVTVFSIPEAAVENRDGRTMLVVDGEETDITDALRADGRYVYQREDEGSVLDIAVEGTPEQWNMNLAVHAPGEEPMYSLTTSSQDGAPKLHDVNVGQEEGGEYHTAVTYDGANFAQVPAEG